MLGRFGSQLALVAGSGSSWLVGKTLSPGCRTAKLQLWCYSRMHEHARLGSCQHFSMGQTVFRHLPVAELAGVQLVNKSPSFREVLPRTIFGRISEHVSATIILILNAFLCLISVLYFSMTACSCYLAGHRRGQGGTAQLHDRETLLRHFKAQRTPEGQTTLQLAGPEAGCVVSRWDFILKSRL